MNIFDSLKANVFGIVTHTMGYYATWVSSESGISYTARIGFKDPSEKEYLAGLEDYDPNAPYLDYFVGYFPGLKESSDAGNPEYVEVEGKGFFVVLKVVTKVDGDTYIAKLQISE